MKTKVSIVKCPDYDEAKVKAAIRQSVELAGGLDKVIKPKDKVILKINLMAPSPIEKAVTTHPAVIKAVIKLVQEAGGVPVVADSPGVYSVAQKNRVMRKSGILELAESLGAEAVQFECVENPFIEVEVENGQWLKRLSYARLVLEADVVINLPKLKTHGLTFFTGAVKNMFGVIAPNTRREAHQLADQDKFSGAVVDIFSARKPDFVIMDGVIGMEGSGPNNGRPKPLGLILASNDCVSLDAVGSRIIGFNPEDVYTTRFANERGIGVGELTNIETLGENINDVFVDFEKPGIRRASIPRALFGFFDRYLKVQPHLVKDKCTRCKVCEQICPVEVIKMAPYPVIDREKCIECFCCNEMCDEGAMEIRSNWLAKTVKWPPPLQLEHIKAINKK